MKGVVKDWAPLIAGVLLHNEPRPPKHHASCSLSITCSLLSCAGKTWARYFHKVVLEKVYAGSQWQNIHRRVLLILLNLTSKYKPWRNWYLLKAESIMINNKMIELKCLDVLALPGSTSINTFRRRFNGMCTQFLLFLLYILMCFDLRLLIFAYCLWVRTCTKGANG